MDENTNKKSDKSENFLMTMQLEISVIMNGERGYPSLLDTFNFHPNISVFLKLLYFLYCLKTH